uniref:Uncharacterized protein n=1 Tax=Sphingobacterium sp. (strain 21) TaxID=743722 RepID=F4C4W7_SPHS2
MFEIFLYFIRNIFLDIFDEIYDFIRENRMIGISL